MKKYLFPGLFIASLAFLFISNCNKNQTNDSQLKDSINSPDLNEIYIVLDSAEYFIEPESKTIAGFLSKGEKLTYISKGNVDTIDNIVDFWYQISWKDKKAWVFGSKTSLAQNSGFIKFLEIFSSNVKDSISINYANKYLKGYMGFVPMEYIKLNNARYAAIFIKKSILFDAEILLAIYENGQLVGDHVLYKGNYLACTAPHAFFTSQKFVKLVEPICTDLKAKDTYIQILDNNNIKLLKSSIIAKNIDELLPKIKVELNYVDKSVSKECKCTVHSSVKAGFTDKNIIFYSIVHDQCEDYCSSYDYSIVATTDSVEWYIKWEEKGVFHAIYESGIKNQYIVVLKETRLKHIYEKIVNERLFLLDKEKQILQELNLKSESCTILSPNNYGCDFCIKHTTRSEELIFSGNPLNQVLKKVKIIAYDRDDACKQIEQNSYSETYLWKPDKLIFELQK